MSQSKRRQRIGRLNKVFDAFINEKGLKTGEFTVEYVHHRGWSVFVNSSPKLGVPGCLLWKKDGHIWCSLAQGQSFASWLALCMRAAKHATGENCFFCRNGVVYFKSVLLEVPYGTEFKIPNRGEVIK